jgi:hypothetical protein
VPARVGEELVELVQLDPILDLDPEDFDEVVTVTVEVVDSPGWLPSAIGQASSGARHRR